MYHLYVPSSLTGEAPKICLESIRPGIATSKPQLLIVATDYQGLGTPGLHPYGLSRPLAYGVLDSIRAVGAAHFNLSMRVVVFGQSQGGRAAFATAGYAKAYAPEMAIVGVLATGTPHASAQPAGKSPELENARHSVVLIFAYNLLRLSTVPLLEPSFIPADYLSDHALPAFKASQEQCLHTIEQRVVADGPNFNTSSNAHPRPRWTRSIKRRLTPRSGRISRSFSALVARIATCLYWARKRWQERHVRRETGWNGIFIRSWIIRAR